MLEAAGGGRQLPRPEQLNVARRTLAFSLRGWHGSRGRSSTYGRAVQREESRERMRNLDLRMQAIETYVTSSNSQLAREIEELR